jgi:hypothetical protein
MLSTFFRYILALVCFGAGGCHWFTGANQGKSGSVSGPASQSYKGVVGSPLDWLMAQEQDSVHRYDPGRDVFVFRSGRSGEDVLVYQRHDSMVVRFDQRGDFQDSVWLPFRIQGLEWYVGRWYFIHTETFPGRRSAMIYLYGRHHMRLAGFSFFGELLPARDGMVLWNQEGGRCEESQQIKYGLEANVWVQKEWLRYMPNCGVDSAQLIIATSDSLGNSMSLPMHGNRRMVRELYEGYWD